jgi:hypothetical protein
MDTKRGDTNNETEKVNKNIVINHGGGRNI